MVGERNVQLIVYFVFLPVNHKLHVLSSGFVLFKVILYVAKTTQITATELL